MSKADLLASALDEFLSVSPEVEAAAVVSADGLPIASALPPHVEEDRLAAMSAALLTLGERAAEGLGKGELAQVFVEGDLGHVVLMSAGQSAVLVAVSSHAAKVGLVLFEMRRTANQVAHVMLEGVLPPVEPLAGGPPSTVAPALETQPAPGPYGAPALETQPAPGPYGAPATPAPAPAPVVTPEAPVTVTDAGNGVAPTGTPTETFASPAASPPEPVAPVRPPEPTPAGETESSVSSWT